MASVRHTLVTLRHPATVVSMTKKTNAPAGASQFTTVGTEGTLSRPRPASTRLEAPEPPGLDEPEFAMRFSSTPRGARLARRLTAHRLDTWGLAYGSEAHDDITLIVAELCANAVQHGRVPGRDFHLRLRLTTVALGTGRTVRVEVTDTRAERLPVLAPVPALVRALVTPDSDRGPVSPGSGCGLVIVARLAARWGWHPRTDGPGKTVWAEVRHGSASRYPLSTPGPTGSA
jgi:anti-sigma regulatory factor (Ser/Thr protein kinase)